MGRYTGTTDIELSPEGVAQVSSTAATLVGAGKLLDPSRLAHVFVSPRKRARTTFELLRFPLPFGAGGGEEAVSYTEDIAEWDYGDYEGLKAGEIRRLRKEKGLDREREWNIWRDGCEGGEYVVLSLSSAVVYDGPNSLTLSAPLLTLTYRSMQKVSERLDRLISQIRDIQRPCMSGEGPADVLLVSSSPFFISCEPRPSHSCSFRLDLLK